MHALLCFLFLSESDIKILSYLNSYQYILFYSYDIIFKIVFLTQLIRYMKYEKIFFRQPRIFDDIHFLIIIIKYINCMHFGVIFLEWSLRGFSVLCNSSSCLRRNTLLIVYIHVALARFRFGMTKL